MAVSPGTAPSPDDVYDPDVLQLVEAIRARRGGSLQDTGIDSARRSLESITRPPGPEMRSVEAVEFAGPHGVVPMRIYRPHSAPEHDAPALLWFHGGGMIMGTLDSFDLLAREVADSTQAVVINVATGSHPNTGIRSPTTRPMPHCSGYTTVHTIEVWTRRASGSVGTAPEVVWQRLPPCGHATTAVRASHSRS